MFIVLELDWNGRTLEMIMCYKVRLEAPLTEDVAIVLSNTKYCLLMIVILYVSD